jgi:cytochrome c oxidase assembly protein subunit 15
MIYELPPWFLKTFRFLVIEVAALIVFGASVRVMNAGLACPDWPLCFGQYVPDFHPQVYFEFIHRVMAGSVAIITVALTGVLLSRKAVPLRLKLLGVASVLVLLGQIVLGGLTVLWQLKSGVVAAHLGIGTLFFAILLWMSLDLKAEVKGEAPPKLPAFVAGWATFLLVAIYVQLLLGGLVASNYAALACTDFPKCQGQWFPSFEGPVGLHMIHRYGAYTIALLAVLNLILMKKVSPYLRKQAGMMMGVVFVQIGLGIANVLFYTPPIVAILHLAMGLKIFFLAVRQCHYAQSADVVAETSPATASSRLDLATK